MVENLTVLVIDSGARGHAISSAYERSKHVKKIIVAPGNDFISFKRDKEIVLDKNCDLNNPESILEIARRHKPDLVDVAQDNALAAGAVDLLQRYKFQVFGPTKRAARIEWDKKWSREFMGKNGIPCPDFGYFDSEIAAEEYVRRVFGENPNKLVYVKATGLCAGKGALRAESLEEARVNIRRMRDFKEAGRVFLVEEGLVGEEFSYYAISDGFSSRFFKSAQDNKTVFDFDEGDQTGGMGAVSPAMVTANISDKIECELMEKIISGMGKKGILYSGILYLGGIVLKRDSRIMNIEYNARWGDPECQAVLPSLETDYLELVEACLKGRLDKINLHKDNKARVCVVGSARGYPRDYSQVRGKEIFGLEQAMRSPGVKVFGAGIDIRDGKFYANGGRLFGVVGSGENIVEARGNAYSAIRQISVDGDNLHYRNDIGWRDTDRFLRAR